MPGRLTLQEAHTEFGIPVRKLAYLIRQGLLEAELEGEHLLVQHSELRRYSEQPPEVVRQHHVSYIRTLGPGGEPRDKSQLRHTERPPHPGRSS